METDRSLIGWVALGSSQTRVADGTATRADIHLTAGSSSLQLPACSCQANAQMVSIFLLRYATESSTKISQLPRKVDFQRSYENCSQSNDFAKLLRLKSVSFAKPGKPIRQFRLVFHIAKSVFAANRDTLRCPPRHGAALPRPPVNCFYEAGPRSAELKTRFFLSRTRRHSPGAAAKSWHFPFSTPIIRSFPPPPSPQPAGTNNGRRRPERRENPPLGNRVEESFEAKQPAVLRRGGRPFGPDGGQEFPPGRHRLRRRRAGRRGRRQLVLRPAGQQRLSLDPSDLVQAADRVHRLPDAGRLSRVPQPRAGLGVFALVRPAFRPVRRD